LEASLIEEGEHVRVGEAVDVGDKVVMESPNPVQIASAVAHEEVVLVPVRIPRSHDGHPAGSVFYFWISAAGKLLLRSERLRPTRYSVRYVKLTPLSNGDLGREIAIGCGFDISGAYPVLIRKLQDAFRSQADVDGLRPVLMIDESQDLRPDVPATLRVLTNFDMDSRLVLAAHLLLVQIEVIV
jgi:hypothetical protein